jgi:hypothetical protein
VELRLGGRTIFPTNGEGFESTLAYTVAGHLGYFREDVRRVRVPFIGALEPGPKMFDANLSQFSITDQRRAAVDLSCSDQSHRGDACGQRCQSH